MSKLLSNSLAACGLAFAAAALCASPAFAADAKPAKSAKPHHAKAKKAEAEPVAEAASDEPEPDVTDTTVTEFNCELGAKITIYANENDATHIALRWKKRLNRLERVGTTTGAQRFENTRVGLIWIGIPSKGMLLDSKLNRQLANECRNATQEKADKAAATPESQQEKKS